MVRSLTNQQLEKLRVLYQTGQYTKISLADKFNCSITTIALWIPIDDTERMKKFYLKKPEQVCKQCGVTYKEHKRCKICTILLHNKDCDCV